MDEGQCGTAGKGGGGDWWCQAWELAADPWISIGKKMSTPKKWNGPPKLKCNGFTPSQKLAKLEDARLFYAVFTSYFLFKSFSFRGPGPHFSADFSILNSHACDVFAWQTLNRYNRERGKMGQMLEEGEGGGKWECRAWEGEEVRVQGGRGEEVRV